MLGFLENGVIFVYWVLIGIPIGLLLALFPGWLYIAPLLFERDRINGGPFKVGDTVQILAGPYKGRVGRVYSTWQGESLRVELGEKAKEDCKDIFSWGQLLREENTDHQ